MNVQKGNFPFFWGGYPQFNMLPVAYLSVVPYEFLLSITGMRSTLFIKVHIQ
jgi:hypothetical protein